MNENTKEVYSVMQDIFKNVWEQQKYSELKNGVLLTFNLAILVILGRTYFIAYEKFNLTIDNKIGFYLCVMLFIIHLFIIIESFFPNDNNKEEKNENASDEINIYFFGDIKKINSDRYLDLLIERIIVDKDKNRDVDIKLLSPLANQIVKISEITQDKYTAFKTSISRLYFLSTIYILFFSYIFFS